MNSNADDSGRVWGVVLAAGESSRYGSTKLLETYRGEPLVMRAVRTARQACGSRVLLVTGHDAGRIADATAPQSCEVVFNDAYTHGIGSSLACAARHLSSRAGALLVLLADQPLVDANHLRRIINAWDGAGKHIVATDYRETTGVPALLPGGTFDDLAGFDDDRGAQRLFDDPRFRLTSIRHDAAAIDVDVPADLARLYGDE